MIARLARLREESGGVLVFVAVALPVLLAVFAIVVDVGNWFVHKRALQNQADAAVLSGSQLWGACFRSTPTHDPMYLEAGKYGGLTAPNYNRQIGGSVKGQLGLYFNSAIYPPDPPTGAAPDDTPPDPCVLGTAADGVQRYLFDVKATEKDVPLIFGNFFPGIVGPDLHARARTELRQVKSLSGLLPIGVTDPSPRWMYAQFVDEDSTPTADAPLTGWLPLCKGGAAGCPAGSVAGNELWTTPTTTRVTIASKNVGVRLKYVWGGTDPNPACGTVLADCYDNSPSQTQANGLVHIRGWPSGGTAPLLHNVWLLAGACTDGYFAAAPCDAGVQAEVDLGNHPVVNPWSNNGACAGGCAQVWATVDGNGSFQLSPPALPLTGLSTWTLTTGLTLPSTGPHPVRLLWEWKQTAGTWSTKPCTNTGSNPCTDTGSFNSGNPVQRAFVADTVRSGPVEGVQVRTSSVSAGANSFQQGTSQSLGVTVKNPCFETEQSDPTCPIVFLRVSTKVTGSQSQSLDCDPNISNLQGEIQAGCSPGYIPFPKVSTETSCPTQSVLWNAANPPNVWDCVAVQTGNQAGQVKNALKARIGTDAATCGNKWPNYPADDRRQVPLFLVPFSAFGNPGSNQTYPVLGFGAFYITGFNGDPCPNATPVSDQGTIAGYFITYISTDPGATPSSKPCDPLALTPCIPVLVK